jgi:MFS superfamily sulfate permease-like transporter
MRDHWSVLRPPRIAERVVSGRMLESIRQLPRSSYRVELIAGLTLLAIAIPEQLATAQLAEVPPFLALLAFLAATLVFATIGSNPIMSIGADSSIAPLFASAVVAVAAAGHAHYLSLVSGIAVLTGLMIGVIGVARLGWVANFLSAPIVAGFMTGIGIVIIIHQLPHALGIPAPIGSPLSNLAHDLSNLTSANLWCVAIAAMTTAIVVVGEIINPKLPSALVALVVSMIVVAVGDLAAHGVTTLGEVVAIGPTWRLSGLSLNDLAIIGTTAISISIVIVSQSAATSRDSADELGVDVSINRDFFAIGVANVVTGLVGTIPVNASPARTDVVRLSMGRSQLVGLVAGGGVIVMGLFTGVMSYIPTAALAGVLFYIGGHLVRVGRLRHIARVDYYEFALAMITAIGVVTFGVEVGVAVAVIMAVFDHTRRSIRPTSIVLGRRPDSTSWEPIGEDGAVPNRHVAVVLFGASLYFANAGIFRSEIHAALHAQPEATHLVLDAAAMTDVDFTGLSAIEKLVIDVGREGMDVVMARANDRVARTLRSSDVPEVASMPLYSTVNEAVTALKQ